MYHLIIEEKNVQFIMFGSLCTTDGSYFEPNNEVCNIDKDFATACMVSAKETFQQRLGYGSVDLKDTSKGNAKEVRFK